MTAVPAFLDADWCAALTTALEGVPVDPAAQGSVVHVIAGGPAGEARIRVALVGGTVTVAPAEAGGDDEPTLTTPYAEAVAIGRGELDPNVTFMRGRSKTTGATGPLLAVLAVQGSEPFRGALAAVAADTDFG